LRFFTFIILIDMNEFSLSPASRCLDLADIPVRICTRFALAEMFFASNGKKSARPPAAEVFVTDEDWTFLSHRGILPSAKNETSVLTAFASDALFAFNRLIIHAAAICRNDRAYLIIGPPGEGKSTQVRMLQKNHPGEFFVICGDRPILKLGKGEIVVHPSPWNGKENWHGAPAAPLAGIVCLQRGDENAVFPWSVKDAVIPVFHSIIQTYSSTDSIVRSCSMESDILKAVPVWKMVTYAPEISSRILYDTVFSC